MIAGSGWIPTNINVNYDEQATNTIKSQNWSITKLNQRVKDLKAELASRIPAAAPDKKPKSKKKQNTRKSPTNAKNKSRKADGEPKVTSSRKPGASDH